MLRPSTIFQPVTRVEAQDNPQMQLYGLGALAEYEALYDIQTVRMTIFQPRLSGPPLRR